MAQLLNSAQTKRLALVLDGCGVCKEKVEFLNAVAPGSADDLAARLEHARQFAERSIELNAASKGQQ